MIATAREKQNEASFLTKEDDQRAIAKGNLEIKWWGSELITSFQKMLIQLRMMVGPRNMMRAVRAF
jgi:hypothetical protein